MTRVMLLQKNGRYIGVSAKGHAEYAPYGEDIVCSAVSALVQGLAIGLDVAGISAKISFRNGCSIMLKKRRKISLQTQSELLFETLYRALRSIEIGYPGNLSVMIRELRYVKGGVI